MSSWGTDSGRALEGAPSFPAFERPAHVPTQVMETAANLDSDAVAECLAALRVYNDETRAFLDFIEDEEANEGRSLYIAAKEKLAGVFRIGREALRSVAAPARRLPLSPAIHDNPSLVLVVGGWSSREEARDADMAKILSLAHNALVKTWHYFDGTRPNLQHTNPTGDVRMEVKWHVGSLAAGFKVNEQGNRVQQLWEDDLSLFENSFRVVVAGDLVVDKASYAHILSHTTADFVRITNNGLQVESAQQMRTQLERSTPAALAGSWVHRLNESAARCRLYDVGMYCDEQQAERLAFTHSGGPAPGWVNGSGGVGANLGQPEVVGLEPVKNARGFTGSYVLRRGGV